MTKRPRVCPCDQCLVDPVAAQFRQTVRRLRLHAHADPDIGVKHVRPGDRGERVFLAPHVSPTDFQHGATVRPGGWYFFGAAMTSRKSASRAAAHSQEIGTLHAPSPR